eukprot:8540440-Lingulodinium_polyedra.AAC.1
MQAQRNVRAKPMTSGTAPSQENQQPTTPAGIGTAATPMHANAAPSHANHQPRTPMEIGIQTVVYRA